MSYTSIESLPAALKEELPPEALEIYLAGYNEEWRRCQASASYTQGREPADVANDKGWLKVEQEFEKDADGVWRRRPIGEYVDDEEVPNP